MRAMLRKRNAEAGYEVSSESESECEEEEEAQRRQQPTRTSRTARFSLSKLRASRTSRKTGASRKSSNMRKSRGGRFSRIHGGSSKAKQAVVSSCGGFCDHRPVSMHFLKEFWDAVLQEILGENLDVCVLQQDFLCTIKDREKNIPRGASILKLSPNADDNDTVIARVPDVGQFEIPESLLVAKDRAQWTVEDVVSFIIRPHPQVDGVHVPFNEVVAYDDPSTLGKPHQGLFVSYSRGMRFQDLLDSLTLHFQGRNPKKSYVWLDVFGVVQALPESMGSSLRAEVSRGALLAHRRELITTGLDRLIRTFAEVALVLPSWDDPAPLDRLWCLWELFFAEKHEAKLSVLSPPGDAQFLPGRLVGSCEEILGRIASIDFANATTSMRGDGRLIRTAAGQQKLNSQAINDKVQLYLEAWLLEAIRAQIVIVTRKRQVRSDEHRLEAAALLENEAILLLRLGLRADAIARLNEALGFAQACAGSSNVREQELHEILDAVNKGDDPGFSSSAGASGTAPGSDFWDKGSIWSGSSGESTKASQSSGSSGARSGFRSVRGGRRQRISSTHSLDEISDHYTAALELVQSGKPEEAYEKFSEALSWLRKLPADQRDGILAGNVLVGMADVLVDQGNFNLALRRAQEALELRRDALGDIDVEVAATISRIGKIHYLMGDTEQALETLASALRVSQQLENSKASLTVHVETLRVVADAFASQNYLQDATQHLDKAVEAIRDFADVSPVYAEEEAESAIASVLQHAAIILSAHGEYERAAERLQQARLLFTSGNGPRSSQVADCINNLAVVYDEQGLCIEALEAYEEALEIFSTCLGMRHARVADTYYNMGAVLIQLKRYNEALLSYTEALQIYLVLNHPHVARAYNNIAVVHQLMGNFDEAFIASKQALKGFEETLGPEHPQTQRMRTKIERLQKRRNRELARDQTSGTKKESKKSRSRSKVKGRAAGSAKERKPRAQGSRRAASTSPHGIDEAAIAEAAKREDMRRTTLYLAKKRNDDRE
ncbi:Kinesin light chain [Hondaea fermentalgiana]|uniref:Kinesin light chain n=1 Tax=Hondaea fermentalgiana TaxID=2315210 RepID=A0A2R5GEL8_9STRA|nr:Kinesin light chain [Hondaea fermentalgiana]|eukprot:GBG28198.1 Kinesin light chain [Hondaea fermentalgiana]